MRRLSATLFLCAMLWPLGVVAQEALPDRFVTISRDTDFPGGDLRTLFDTTLEACEAACRADPDCAGFTFNSRNGSCFPKSELGEGVAYDGAYSGRFTPTDSDALSGVDARVAALSFLDAGDLAAARRQAVDLGRAHYAGAFTADAWRQSAQGAADAGNPDGAMRMMGAAVTVADLPGDWADYARFLLRLEGGSYSERRDRQTRALSASVNAALRAAEGAQLANALSVMAEALEALDRGADMIPALRLALGNQPSDTTDEALDRAIGLFGFRVLETSVDNEAEFPRICVIFSEPLAAGGVIYDDFVQSTTSGLAVEAEDRQLCLSGVSHGARYEFTLRAGLPAASGEALRNPVTLRQYVRDRAPSVRFTGRAYVLPASAGGTIPLVAVNTDLVDLRLYQVSDRNILRSLQDQYFGRPLNDWEVDRFAEEIGEAVWQGEAEVASEPNRGVTTRLPIGEVLEGRAPGLYALEARVGGAGTAEGGATQWFLVSDLGVSSLSGSDGVHVVVRSLATTEAREGVSVQLVAEANRVLAEAVTDAEGYAYFPGGLSAGDGGASPALLILRDGDSDLAFLSLREAEFDLSDRGVEGREPSGAIDLFLATDRGAYRAGETIHATALARDPRATAIGGVPLTAILTRADGVEYSRTLLTETGAGGYVFDLPLGQDVPRGTWRLAVHANPDSAPLGETRLLVEDFLPERIDVDLSLPEGPLDGISAPLSIAARYLFGAPATNLAVEGRLALTPSFTRDDYPLYRFGRHDAPPDAVFDSFRDLTTDDAGETSLNLRLPQFEGVSQPGLLTITAQVAEGSGRPVERQITRAVLPRAPMIGIRPLFDSTLPEGTEAEFDLIATGAEPLPVRWTLNRVERRYQWYRDGGSWSWDPVTTRTRIANGETTLGAEPERLSLPVDWGRYELRVESDVGDFTLSSVGFSAGWYGAEDGTDTPDVLEVSLDASAYAPGDTATLRIVPRVGGLALVQVVTNELIDMQIVELGDDPTEITLPVTEEWGAGAYVTATLIRPLNDATGPVPTRALGLAHAAVDPGDRALTATLDLPEITEPRQPLDVALRVEGAQPGETVHATIAAVDLGILNLTGFDSPDPQTHYFGQRRLGVAFRDLYGRLIDSRDGAEGRIRQGGDAGAGLRMQTPPPTEDLVAEFSGPLTVGEDGIARASFDIPAFNGTVRVMAIAWSDTGVGQASADVIVRDPVVVTASLPRFLSPGDSARMLLEITHAEGPVGTMPISILSTSGVAMGPHAASVDLAEGGTARLSVPIVALGAPGPQEITVSLTTPDGRVLIRDLAIEVQVNDPVVAETSRVTLAPGQSFLLDSASFSGFRPESARVTVSAGPLARFDAAGLLQMLDRYPYGCTEQVTSQALPLLYLADVAEAMDLGTADDLFARIDDAIRAVLTNQSAGGGFGLWDASSGDLWLDAYVTDFLSRARAQGFVVPDVAFRLALDNLANEVASHPDFENGGEGLAYALMVLAQEGQASMGDLRYYADVKADQFATPLALGQLGAALAMYGDQPRADRMFLAGYARLNNLTSSTEDRRWRIDYGTARRDAAGLVALAVAARSDVIDIAAIVPEITGPIGQTSTQEAVWTLLAAYAQIQNPGAPGLTLDGAPVSGPLVEVLDADNPAARTIRNTGTREEALTVTRFGIPEGETEAFGNGYRIERRYLTLEGQAVDPASVEQGTRLVTVLTVIPTGAPDGRLMVSDPLPAGFEIDNPNLLQSGDIRALDGVELQTYTAMTEFRRDRFLAALDYYEGPERLQLAYIVRAVTPGEFRHPAASVEDMYRPTYRAQTASGRVTVTE